MEYDFEICIHMSYLILELDEKRDTNIIPWPTLTPNRRQLDHAQHQPPQGKLAEMPL